MNHLEYDPNVQSSLNERVLQGKRKRLLETFDNLVSLYVRFCYYICISPRKKRILSMPKTYFGPERIMISVDMI